MGELKDLFEITQEDFEKKEKKIKSPKLNTETKEEKKISAEIKNTKEISEPKNEKEKKKVKKHFKYKDGKVKYSNIFNKEMKPEDIKDTININRNRADKSIFLRNASITILIFSIIFMYFYYIRGDSFEKTENPKSAQVEEGQTQEVTGSENLKIEETVSSKETINPKETTDEALIYEDFINEIKAYNSKEVEKVNKYLSIKSNRVSTVADIKKYKEKKEDLYLKLNNSALNFEAEEFRQAEDLLIRSISMSTELLSSFESNKGNNEIKKILDSYF